MPRPKAPALAVIPPQVFSASLNSRIARTAREQEIAAEHEWSYDPYDGFPYPPMR
jgi:hypothetical protein